jgi:hypothetical protein
MAHGATMARSLVRPFSLTTAALILPALGIGPLVACDLVAGLGDFQDEATPTGGAGGLGAAGAGEGGTGGCAGDLQTCPGTLACSVALASDSTHCGECGHDCQGGACIEGICQPVILVDNVERPREIEIDGDAVYFTTSGPAGSLRGEIRGCAIGACIEGTSLIAGGLDGPRALSLAGAHLYWATNTPGLAHCELPDCQPESIDPGTASIGTSAAYGTRVVYASNLQQGAVYQCIQGSLCSSLFGEDQVFPSAMAIDESGIGWTTAGLRGLEPGQLWLCGPGGAASCELRFDDPEALGGIALDADAAYFFSDGLGTQPGRVLSCSRGGCSGGPTELAEVTAPTALAIDDDYVYWLHLTSKLDGKGALSRCPKAGCSSAEVLAENLDDPSDLEIAAGVAYWGSDTTRAAIHKLVLPP